MKNKLLNGLMTAILFLMPNVNYGQAPTLGTTANFVLFTTVGAVTNSGIPHLTHLTGNVGTNSGSSTGFGNVNGQMHDNDGVTATCKADLLTAYGQLNTAIPTFFPSPLLGNGDTLVAGVYYISAASTMNLNLFLDAKGNPSAVFIFQIQGSFSTSALSKVILINGAVACNVFWKVEGLVSMGAGTTMRGTIVADNAAINMNANDTLEGRALSINGAVTTNAVMAYTPIGCGSPALPGPAAPALASTACYSIFSGDGPVTNAGSTYATGDIGTNVGLTTGFNPLFIAGTIHPIPDGSTAACATDLGVVYTYLNTLTADIELLYPAQFGNSLVLTPHTYIMKAATTFTDSLYLDALGDVNAVFVIQINGALTTSTFSRVILINGTQAKNVYWKVDGAVHIYDYSVFNGTLIVNNAAINLNTGVTINGRALTTIGAVGTAAITVNLTSGCAGGCLAPVISGSPLACVGQTTTLSNSTVGGTWTSSNIAKATIDSASGIVTGVATGTATITYTLSTGCTRTMAVTVNPSAYAITGTGNVCTGSTMTLTDVVTGGAWSSSNTMLATVGSVSGLVTGIAAGTPTISYTLSGGCAATKAITINPLPNAGSITGASSVCAGSTITLTDIVIGGVWSSSSTKATVLGGIVTGITSGIDTIKYVFTNICGTATATKAITINPLPIAGSITGASSVCAGSTITLTDVVTGGVWSSSSTKATVLGGIVTGVTSGIDTIKYVFTNVCGTATATKTVSVNILPVAGLITGLSSVCVGAVIFLSDVATGGLWSSSSAKATVSGGLVVGVVAGTDTIKYSVTNVCATVAAIAVININIFPVTGAITGAGIVCQGSTIMLSDAAADGVWSSSNTSISVVSGSGITTGVTEGLATISYIVTNACGTATAVFPIKVLSLMDCGILMSPVVNTTFMDVKLYPNPNRGVFTVSGSLGTNNDEDVSLEITNMLGQVVYNDKFIVKNGSINETVQPGNKLVTGVYMLSIRTATGHHVFQFTVSK